MAAELNALRAIADKLIQSNQLILESWDLDLSACLPIAKAHLTAWSNDRQARADRRARGKTLFSAYKSNRSTGGTFIMDSKLETMAVRHLRVETQGLNKSNNAIANACAETFLSRTSAPYYHGEPNAYPFLAPNDAKVTSRAKDIWVYLRESSGSLNSSISQDFRRFRYYFSVPVRVALLVRSGLLDQESASNVMKKVYPHGVYVPIFQRGNPGIKPDLGAELHTLGDPADKLRLAAIACRGVFSGLYTWDRFNSVLVQGGWPWLRQYSRAYAKMIYTVMVLIFAAIENYEFNDMDAMRMRILALAGKLVGSPSGGPSPWRVRESVYLRGPNVTIPVRCEAQTGNSQPVASGHAGPAIDTIPWSHLPTPTPLLSQPLPSHIILGTACTHTQLRPSVGRVKVAHSLSELEGATADNDSITIAMTQGVESARQEVWAWVAQRAMMTVRAAEGQCIGCAVKLAHCVGALVIVV